MTYLQKVLEQYQHMQWQVILVLLVIVILILIVSLRNKGYNYQQREALFTPAERSFLLSLDKAISTEYRVFGKVRIADILKPSSTKSRKKWHIAFNKISSKHFDYVLCNKDTLKVVAVIELDDKSHQTKKVMQRDIFVEAACKSAKLILIRFPAKSRYSAKAIREKIDLALG